MLEEIFIFQLGYGFLPVSMTFYSFSNFKQVVTLKLKFTGCQSKNIWNDD
jgi:hypothetical protein